MEKLYPVYTANIGTPFGYADFYNNTQPALISVNDGAAGRCYIVNDNKYVIGKHASGFKVKKEFIDEIDLNYLMLKLEPLFISKNKAQGLGNLPQVDMLNTEITIPITSDGKFDIKKQREITDKYKIINEEKEKLIKQKELIDNFQLKRIEGYSMKNIPLFKLFEPHQGNAIYTKKNIHNNKWTGNIPVISSNTDNEGILDYIDKKYIKDKDFVNVPCLTWSVDGYAGKLFARNLEQNPIGFVANNHCGILFPIVKTENLYFPYLVYILQPDFFSRTKNSANKKLGNNQIESIVVPIPVDKNGNFDLLAQKEIVSKYELVEKTKKVVSKKLDELIELNIDLIS